MPKNTGRNSFNAISKRFQAVLSGMAISARVAKCLIRTALIVTAGQGAIWDCIAKDRRFVTPTLKVIVLDFSGGR
jgi:hypothetical protein